jgi:hypothetical protein
MLSNFCKKINNTKIKLFNAKNYNIIIAIKNDYKNNSVEEYATPCK